MDRSSFATTSRGVIRRTLEGYDAFYPERLPRVIGYSSLTVKRLEEAVAGVHRLAGASRLIPDPMVLLGPYVRLEAVLSSRIEGTEATVHDLLKFEADDDARGDVREVWNYQRALDHGMKRLVDFPLSLRLIREMHAILLDGVRGGHQAPGEFRKTQNWIGAPGCTLTTATFVPPPPEELGALLADLERFLHEDDLPALVTLALAHYQFEAIHPFLDGNGRIGRLLVPLVCAARGILRWPMLYVSAYFEEHRSAYYDRLLAVSRTGDFGPWLDFFLTAIAVQARDAEERAVRLVDLQRSLREGLLASRASVNAVRLAETLLSQPYLTAAMAQRFLEVTNPTAQKAIRALEDRGILVEVTGQSRYRIWQAPSIIDAVYGEQLTGSA
ncbi:MAG TPA: Fic family protein [Acidimicrobiales bacterium]|nr:Fic family protein [Acidimicrobiales bacterium]